MTATERWLAAFEPINVSDLRNSQARDVAAFVRQYAQDIAAVVDLRRNGSRELIVLELLTGAPQAPVYPIRAKERIGILFRGEGSLPYVVILRDDFPDTEHQNLVPEGHPATICIDDRSWREARLSWTPAELIDRIVLWFRRAARGELHDARQPVDPILVGSKLSFFIARSILDADDAGDLIGEHDPENDNVLRVKRWSEVPRIVAGMEPITVAVYRIRPERMKRLRRLPTDLGGLATMLTDHGVDLLYDLRARLSATLAEISTAARRLNASLAIILEMPILSPRQGQESGVDMRAFVTTAPAGQIAVALGIAFKSSAVDQGSKVGYVKAIGSPITNHPAISAISIQGAEVHLEFERDIAARLAGHQAPDRRKAVLVGAGAIGSHIADCLIREGRFVWTVVDDDRILPHNLARHVARSQDVMRPKAVVLADHINGIVAGGERGAQPVVANLFDVDERGAAVAKALSEADIIIDATASVAAERALSDCKVGARRLSAFFNPSGEAAVLLIEPQDRSVTLRALEAQYLGLVLRTPRLADHLGKLAETIAYTGACRAITNRIPQSRAALLAGLVARGISTAADELWGKISVWTLAPDGEVVHDAAAVELVWQYKTQGWCISIGTGLVGRIIAMRQMRLPSETGGMLFGIVDIPAKRIHLVDATTAPPDSVEEPSSFVRGARGVDEIMESVQRRTAGQVRYVGEWHSHPIGTTARPSSIDAMQIDWLAALTGMDTMPALMVIAADTELAVVFARQHAELMPQESWP